MLVFGVLDSKNDMDPFPVARCVIYLQHLRVIYHDFCTRGAEGIIWNIPISKQGELFSSTNKIVLPEPGGWSARGQPCDAVHAQFRKYMAFHTENWLGYRSPLLDRANKAPLLMSNGNRHLGVPHTETVLSTAYGWQRLSKQKKLLRPGFQKRRFKHVATLTCLRYVT